MKLKYNDKMKRVDSRIQKIRNIVKFFCKKYNVPLPRILCCNCSPVGFFIISQKLLVINHLLPFYESTCLHELAHYIIYMKNGQLRVPHSLKFSKLLYELASTYYGKEIDKFFLKGEYLITQNYFKKRLDKGNKICYINNKRRKK